MARSDATTVEAYLDELEPERRATVETVREVVRANLPEGYVEAMRWGMICYEVPLERFADTYNGQPLMYAALASQKRHLALYLTAVYADEELRASFEERYADSGKRMDMGKSCVRFRKVDDLPLDLIGETIARVPVDDFIARQASARSR